MKHSLLLLLLLLTGTALYAQDNDLMFAGSATTKDGTTYSYLLKLTNTNGTLKGYSITDNKGPNEIKTAVTGTINISKKILDIKEISVMSTKVLDASSQVCFIHAHLKIAELHGLTVLKGQFNGYLEDGKTICESDGKLALICKQDLLAQPRKDTLTPAVTAQPKPTTNYVYETVKEIPDNKVLKVMPGKTLELACSSPIVTVDVWDAKTIDGDIITLKQDNTTLLDNYTLMGLHKQLTLNTGSAHASVLTLIAISEGTEPLNTARLKITSGDDTYYVDATTTIGKMVTITLKR